LTDDLTTFGRVVAGLALVLAASGVARANGIIDPVMRVLDDDFSNAILQGTTFFPNGTGGGVFGFFNPTNANITELAFQATILPGLDQPTITSAFACNQGNFNPFFQFCSVTYAPSSGALQIAFWGTNPTTNPAGPQQGVPTLPSGCTSTPDALGCTTQGHFAISMADTFDIHAGDQSGGWSFAKNPLLFDAAGPTFTTTDISTVFGAAPTSLVPEPAPIGIVGGGLAMLVWFSARRRRRGASPDPESRS
jgi:hypothetical protein